MGRDVPAPETGAGFAGVFDQTTKLPSHSPAGEWLAEAIGQEEVEAEVQSIELGGQWRVTLLSQKEQPPLQGPAAEFYAISGPAAASTSGAVELQKLGQGRFPKLFESDSSGFHPGAALVHRLEIKPNGGF